MPAGQRQGRSVLPGVFLIALLLGVALTIVFAERIARAFGSRYEFVVTFHEAPGLEAGSEVWVAGRPVGRVVTIALVPPGHGLARIAANIELPTEVQPHVRHDGEVRLGSAGVTGDAVVMIEPGTLAAPVVEPGDTVHARAAVRPDSLLVHAIALRASLDSLFDEAGDLQERAAHHAPAMRALRDELSAARHGFDELATAYRDGPLAAFLKDPELPGALARARRDMEEVQRRAGERASAFEEAPPGEQFRALAQRSTLLTTRLAALRALIDDADGFRARWEHDPAILEALETTRAQLDSLIAETMRRPWRYVF